MADDGEGRATDRRPQWRCSSVDRGRSGEVKLERCLWLSSLGMEERSGRHPWLVADGMVDLGG